MRFFDKKNEDSENSKKIFLDRNDVLKICYIDVEKMYNYAKNIGITSGYTFGKYGKETKYIRIKINESCYKLDINKMYLDRVKVHSNYYPLFNIKINDFYLHLELFTKIEIIKEDNIEFTPVDVNHENKDVISFSCDLNYKNRNSNSDFLLCWRTYIDSKLSELDTRGNKVYSYVDLKELRNNIDYWKSISANQDGIIYFPVKVEEIKKIKSVSVVADGDGKIKTDEFISGVNISFSIVGGNDADDMRKIALEEYGYKFVSNIGCIENEIYEDNMNHIFFNKALNYNITKMEIKENVMGEAYIYKRIVNGIDSILDGDILSSNLVEQVLNNNVLDDNSYSINNDNVELLKNKYPNLNMEQIITVDKILKMNDILLIQGPPGTGKTEIISTLVKELNPLKKKILLTSNVQEARRNIISRIKGEKELIVKDFTITNDKDEKYKIQVKKNMIDYFRNQVLDKYIYDNMVIDSDEKINSLINKRNIIKEKLKYIDSLIDGKNTLENNRNQYIQKKKCLENVVSNYNSNRNRIYQLIIKSDIEKIKKDILMDELDTYIYFYNETKLRQCVLKHQKICNKLSEYNDSTNLNFKINFLNDYNLNDINKKDIIGMEFINEYLNSNFLRKLLFNLSDSFSIFEIKGYNKTKLIELLEQNKKIINRLDYSSINSEFLKLESMFLSNIYKEINGKEIKIKEYEVKINSYIGAINTEKNINFGINKELEKLNSFIDSYLELRNEFKNVELFYDYIKNIYNLTDENMIKNSNEYSNYYYENMLCDENFKNKFYCNDAKDGLILSMTTSQVANLLKYNPNIDFDYIIVDEASKCNFNDLIVSLSRTKKLVLIGDYLQLDPVPPRKEEEPRPSYISNKNWDKIYKSNFSQMIKPIVDYHAVNKIENYDSSNSVSVLKKQYRMSKDIFEVTNKIYNAIPGFVLEDGKKDIANPMTNKNNLLVLQCSGNEIPIKDQGFWNLEEVDMIKRIMEEVVRLKKENKLTIKKIGIISFYRRQFLKIRNKITKEIQYLSDNKISVSVGTVDNFQGKEFDLVIISSVRTNDINGWMGDIRRWNVSISRAKDKLIVVGDFAKLYNISLNKLRIIDNNDENIILYKEVIKDLYFKKNDFSVIEPVIDKFLGGGDNE